MTFNKVKCPPIDPFISHMRIAYEEGIRNQTENYWRTKIANEIRMYRVNPNNNIDVLHAQELTKSAIADLVEGKK